MRRHLAEVLRYTAIASLAALLWIEAGRNRK